MNSPFKIHTSSTAGHGGDEGDGFCVGGDGGGGVAVMGVVEGDEEAGTQGAVGGEDEVLRFFGEVVSDGSYKFANGGAIFDVADDGGCLGSGSDSELSLEVNFHIWSFEFRV